VVAPSGPPPPPPAPAVATAASAWRAKLEVAELPLAVREAPATAATAATAELQLVTRDSPFDDAGTSTPDEVFPKSALSLLVTLHLVDVYISSSTSLGVRNLLFPDAPPTLFHVRDTYTPNTDSI